MSLDRYAVIGNPVEHSQSPFIHQQFALQTQQGLQYERLLSPLDGFVATVQSFAAGGAKGCNVTVPFKTEAWSLGVRRSPRAQRAGAANTLRFDRDGWWADNTDGVGLVRDIIRHAGVALAGARVLLVGAGGAAAGVLGELIEQRPAELVCVNRTAAKATELVAAHQALAEARQVALSQAPIEACGTAYDVLINATASSLQGGAAPVAASVLRPGTLALDMMYGAKARGFLDWAAGHGAVGRDGLGMLVEQAAEAFAIWRGVLPDTVAVLAALRARVAGA